MPRSLGDVPYIGEMGVRCETAAFTSIIYKKIGSKILFSFCFCIAINGVDM